MSYLEFVLTIVVCGLIGIGLILAILHIIIWTITITGGEIY